MFANIMSIVEIVTSVLVVGDVHDPPAERHKSIILHPIQNE
jgi:hypothetical protein